MVRRSRNFVSRSWTDLEIVTFHGGIVTYTTERLFQAEVATENSAPLAPTPPRSPRSDERLLYVR